MGLLDENELWVEAANVPKGFRNRLNTTASPEHINSLNDWYKHCSIQRAFCDEARCPACVNDHGEYRCSLGGMSDVLQRLEPEFIECESLESVKHHTVKGGW